MRSLIDRWGWGIPVGLVIVGGAAQHLAFENNNALLVSVAFALNPLSVISAIYMLARQLRSESTPIVSLRQVDHGSQNAASETGPEDDTRWKRPGE